MTLQEKIVQAEAAVNQAAEQAKNWEQNRLVAIGRLQALVELKQEEEAAQAAEKKAQEDAANKPAEA